MATISPPARGGAPAPLPDAAPRRSGRGQGLLVEAGELTIFALDAVKALGRTPRYFSEVMRLNALVTRRTTVLLFAMTFFAGVSIANFGFFFLRSIGASDYVGIIGGLFSTRLLGFQMFGYVFTGAVCCAITAELGSAKIQEEVAAYEAQGIDPMEMLVGTRVLAVLLYVPLATVVTLIGIALGNFVTIVWIYQGNSAETYISTFFSVENIGDYVRLAAVVGAQAFFCTIIACFYGLRAAGGPSGVGNAVARALGVNLVVLHVLISVMAITFWAGQLTVPIGD
jgi:phospholipid/cholesterol/gamma-HCH transport system permease protein